MLCAVPAVAGRLLRFDGEMPSPSPSPGPSSPNPSLALALLALTLSDIALALSATPYQVSCYTRCPVP